jgi:flavin reductase ActVB
MVRTRSRAGSPAPASTGSPKGTWCLASRACPACSVLDGGDHSILVGRVRHTHVDEYRTPLVHYDRTFTRPASVLDVPDPLATFHLADW